MEFRRARSAEQVEVRRASILAAAEALLAEHPLAGISLRELSCRVGLAKSNVLRYFDSREAVFLEVLDRRWSAWLDEAEPLVRGTRPEPVPYGRAIAAATALAGSLPRHPLLCELVANAAGVLERNVGPAAALAFKSRADAHTSRLAELVRGELPQLDDAAARHFAGAVLALTAGLWPHAHPTGAVAAAGAELGHPPPAEAFAAALTESLVNQLIGLVVRAS
ncbi:TetR family transcriptional regulator [Actinosynnema sp. NPDC047251]|uniref:Transcriptional regulator, TetR family n=1 Tax=Saccharothrix espanaensis (strain ATCC 51144 / DSM 44229 / JCM 9112 / NBRC 15066 / NRRL 15764) TaxID=1179773 RepID=K0K2R3_SACES|nr:TetR family transcriptional regulator [Saccharothrix espanaensis]CCH30863.1 Transcriptional regulator, TetR family [Saccharothrix espanaensis DSM 44229]